MASTPQSVIDRSIRFFQRDLSFSLSLGYVLLISLGILFNQFYYGYFGIDAMAYSNLTDYLVTPLRNPGVLIFFMANLAFFFGVSYFDDWLFRKFPGLYKGLMLGISRESEGYKIFKKISFLVALITYLIIGVDILATVQTRRLRKPGAPQVDLVLGSANEQFTKKRHVFVGKIGDFLVVKADTSRKKAIIYPMAEVHEIRMITNP